VRATPLSITLNFANALDSILTGICLTICLESFMPSVSVSVDVVGLQRLFRFASGSCDRLPCLNEQRVITWTLSGRNEYLVPYFYLTQHIHISKIFYVFMVSSQLSILRRDFL
jgi:hypothetical protein